MEFLKGKLIKINPTGDLKIEMWNGGKPVISTPAYESSRVAMTYMKHEPGKFEKNALSRNMLLNSRN